MTDILAMRGTVKVTAPLNVRAGAPSMSAPVAAQLDKGAILTVCGIVQGDAVNGNGQWFAGLGGLYFWSGACSALQAPPVPPPASAFSLPPAAKPGAVVGRIAMAPSGAIGFDCNVTLSAQDVASYKAQGYRFCIRYLALGQSTAQLGDLSTAEANTILDGGLALMAVQHVAVAPWTPSPTLGAQYGNSAASCAQDVGLPGGMVLWLDLQGVAPATPSQDVIGYCNAWAGAVAHAGFVPGLHVGADAILNSDELYWDCQFQHYWCSGADVPDVAIRGYQMFQRIPPDGAISQDATRTDNLGGTALWLVR